MQFLFLTLVALLFSIDWLVYKLNLLPGSLAYFPELFFVIFAVAIIVFLIRNRKISIDPTTTILLVFLMLAIAGSLVINAVSPTVMMSGLRIHVRFLPFLLLPMVFYFSPLQIGRQLKFILAVTLLQVPVAVIQRFVIYAGDRSGDGIGGTLGSNSSGILSVWLACTIAAVIAFSINGKLTRKATVSLLVLLATPMMLNETKVSFVLIPLAVIIPTLFAPVNKGKLKQMLLALAFGATFFAVLIPVYDSFRPGGTTIVEWLSSDEAQRYVYRGETSGGDRGQVKRLDSIALAARNLEYENSLLFGLGPGNVSEAFSRDFQGKYFQRYENFSPGRVHLSTTVWETGLVGTFLFVFLVANNVRVSLRLLNHTDLTVRSMALAWIAITAVVLTTLLYFRMYSISLINCLFWFYSGYLVAENMRQSMPVRAASASLNDRPPIGHSA